MLERLRGVLRRDLSSIEKAQKIASELPESKENWSVNKKGLGIVGDSGGGKTTIANILAEIYDIPETRNFKIGEILRKLSETEKSAGFVHRDPLFDKMVDDLQIELITNAASKEPFILEGRRAGLILNQERAKNPLLGQLVKSVLINVPQEVAWQRLHDRMPTYSLEEIAKLTTNRALEDKDRWSIIHPEESETNPYDPNIFDLVVDARKPIKDVFYDIHNWLVDIKFVEKTEEPMTLENAVIFQA